MITLAAMENYDDWLPMGEVQSLTGMSERTVYRMVAEGKLQRAKRSIPGRKPLPVFDPTDVAELANLALRVRPQIMPPDGKLAQSALAPLVEAFSAGMNAARFPLMTELAELSHKVYLTIEEARRYTGLSVKEIQQAARDGRVKRVGRVYRRTELENL